MVSIRTLKTYIHVSVYVFFISFTIYVIILELLYYALKWNDIHNNSTLPSNTSEHRNTKRSKAGTKDNLKYILLWTKAYPFVFLQEKHYTFTDNNCPHINCYVTRDRNYFKDLRNFHAILFSGLNIAGRRVQELPKKRSPRQKYVFASVESSVNFPIILPDYDNYFNWTWTYRPLSDIPWNYFTIHDKEGNKVGPGADPKWPKTFKPIDKHLKKTLKRKTRAAAWIVSHCFTHGRREDFIAQLKEDLKPYNLTVDVFGGCGNISCTKRECPRILRRHYYFYLSFENSLDEGYVTEKLLNGFNNLAVPIVYGGANYSRYAPPGSYLNARELGPKKLAAVMNTLIKNLTLYYEYFSWTNHLEYKLSYTSTELCNICTALNNKRMMQTTTIYKELGGWWNGPTKMSLYAVLLKNFIINKTLRELTVNYNYSRAANRELMIGLKKQKDFHKVIMNNISTPFNKYLNYFGKLPFANN